MTEQSRAARRHKAVGLHAWLGRCVLPVEAGARLKTDTSAIKHTLN